MADKLAQIKDARNALKENFEIVRHVVDDLYVVKYPPTFLHARIFEYLRNDGLYTIENRTTPERKDITLNKMYLVEQITHIYDRAIVIAVVDEDLFQVWYIDTDEYDTVSLSRIRLAGWFDTFYPLYQLFEIQLKFNPKEPANEFARYSTALEPKDDNQLSNILDFNADLTPIYESPENDTDLKPRVVAFIDVDCDSSDEEEAEIDKIEYVDSLGSSSTPCSESMSENLDLTSVEIGPRSDMDVAMSSPISQNEEIGDSTDVVFKFTQETNEIIVPIEKEKIKETVNDAADIPAKIPADDIIYTSDENGSNVSVDKEQQKKIEKENESQYEIIYTDDEIASKDDSTVSATRKKTEKDKNSSYTSASILYDDSANSSGNNSPTHEENIPPRSLPR